MQTFTGYCQSPIGLLKVQANEAFVTSLSFADAITEPAHCNEVTNTALTQLQEYFNGTRTFFDFPMQQPGTPFQLKVWQLLEQIPYGKTISYRHLALQYGDLKAIRAVAAANGKNHMAIVIPCHRVIGSNDSLTGYAGGLWRKKWLLEHEARFFSGVQQLPFLG